MRVDFRTLEKNGFHELIDDPGIYVGDVTDKTIEACLSQLRGYKQLFDREITSRVRLLNKLQEGKLLSKAQKKQLERILRNPLYGL